MNLGTAGENESDSSAEDRVRDSVPSFLPAGDKRGRAEAEVSDWSGQGGRRRVSVSACARTRSVRVQPNMWREECDCLCRSTESALSSPQTDLRASVIVLVTLVCLQGRTVEVPVVRNTSFAFDQYHFDSLWYDLTRESNPQPTGLRVGPCR